MSAGQHEVSANSWSAHFAVHSVSGAHTLAVLIACEWLVV